MTNNFIKKLALIATAFALVVVLLGAFTRLSDAGLGCPDWPGCYGFKHIPTHEDDIAAANQAFPERPYEFAKAWPEMVHRYFAGTLGLLVLALAILSFKKQNRPAKVHSIGLLLLVTFQAALGMWTVTMNLHPGIVMSHLMGGFTTLVLLSSLSVRYMNNFNTPIPSEHTKPLIKLVVFSTLILVLQIVLGGWTSANYAATVCYELPICQGNWLANSNFAHGFQIWGHGADNYEFGILDNAGRMAIHVAHRIGAIVTSLILIFLAIRLLKFSNNQLLKRFGHLISILLTIQVCLGVFNITFQLPLFNAVAHNGVGALLLVTMGILLTFLLMPPAPSEKQKA